MCIFSNKKGLSPRTPVRGDKFVASEVNNINSFKIHDPLVDSDALHFATQKLVDGMHLEEFGQLICFGRDKEFLIGSNNSGYLGQHPNIVEIGTIGSSHVRPVRANNSLFFLNRNRNRIYEMRYTRDSMSFQTRDITLDARHLFQFHTIEGMTWVDDENLFRCFREDGKVLNFVYVPEERIESWSLTDFGGKVESMVTIPELRKDGERELLKDTTYIIIQRKLKNASGEDIEERLIERLALREVEHDKDGVFVHSGVVFEPTKQAKSKQDTYLRLSKSGEGYYLEAHWTEEEINRFVQQAITTKEATANIVDAKTKRDAFSSAISSFSSQVAGLKSDFDNLKAVWENVMRGSIVYDFSNLNPDNFLSGTHSKSNTTTMRDMMSFLSGRANRNLTTMTNLYIKTQAFSSSAVSSALSAIYGNSLFTSFANLMSSNLSAISKGLTAFSALETAINDAHSPATNAQVDAGKIYTVWHEIFMVQID